LHHRTNLAESSFRLAEAQSKSEPRKRSGLNILLRRFSNIIGTREHPFSFSFGPRNGAIRILASQSCMDFGCARVRRVLKTQVDPIRWPILFEPGHLPFGKLAGANFDQLDS